MVDALRNYICSSDAAMSLICAAQQDRVSPSQWNCQSQRQARQDLACGNFLNAVGAQGSSVATTCRVGFPEVLQAALSVACALSLPLSL